MKDFDNSEKRHFRRTQWNRIAERLTPIQKRDGIVLYLAGDRLLDEAVAVSKGFKVKNLIPVERDPKVVKCLRAQGRTVIHGDLLDTVAQWNGDRPIAAVVGDFFCGLEQDVVDRLILLLKTKVLRNSVIAVNFLRGRDPSSAEIRARAQEILGYYKPAKSPLHRGLQFYVTCVDKPGLDVAVRIQVWSGEKSCVEPYVQFVEFCEKWAKPVDHQYQSGPQRFDSIVFKNVIYDALHAFKLHADQDDIKPFFDERQRFRTAAALAHRTRRYGL